MRTTARQRATLATILGAALIAIGTAGIASASDTPLPAGSTGTLQADNPDVPDTGNA